MDKVSGIQYFNEDCMIGTTVKLGSLFDGIGGFPLSAIQHGIEPVWASEIEPFPIAVTKKHFKEVQDG